MNAAAAAGAARARAVTVGEALAAARARIGAVDARVLLCHVTGRNAARLVAGDRDALEAHQLRGYEALVARRAAGEPVAYLTGSREFFARRFAVSPAVLIPRPETELLVELALERIPAGRPCRVLDLGTGSGCIAVSLACERPQASVTATDVSTDALAVARANAAALGARNLEFAAGAWFAAAADRRFDVIVSNPPYVAADDPHLEAGDLRFEPRGALVGGADGLEPLRVIVRQAPDYLACGGWLLLEHGRDQGAAVRALLREAGLGGVFTRRDLAGNDRVSGGQV
jgi:release factor glutamine methyltransferase